MWRRALTRCWGSIACPTRINCVLYKNYPAAKLVDYVERFLPYKIPIQFRYDYTETTPENLYEEKSDPILQDLKKSSPTWGWTAAVCATASILPTRAST